MVSSLAPEARHRSKGNLMQPRAPRWKVLLTGEESDLNLLSTHFTAPGAKVFEEEGNFFVSSSALEPIDDSHAVTRRAEELVERMNQAMFLKGADRSEGSRWLRLHTSQVTRSIPGSPTTLR